MTVSAIEEARQGLREPVVVGGVGDEAAPAPGDTLEAAERLGRKPRKDLQDDVVGQVGRCRLHLRPSAAAMRD